MAHQYGVTWTVGVLGTALTEEHVRLLKRFSEETILLFSTRTTPG